jgi:hypothetical protein
MVGTESGQKMEWKIPSGQKIRKERKRRGRWSDRLVGAGLQNTTSIKYLTFPKRVVCGHLIRAPLSRTTLTV